ncbi:MAG: dephospho-CoA kinase [Candidatus Coatesbacteria bacterium]|nr:dephospho-CoA kinase [Candidatus Coatesbacteria bacterium]
MLKIGITGEAGSGKSEVAIFLHHAGYEVINADEEGHKILTESEETKKDLLKVFGNSITDREGNIIRSELAKLAFSSNANLELIDRIVGEKLKKRLESIIWSSSNTKDIVLDAALLWDWEFSKKLDYIIYVTADVNLRKKRLLEKGWQLEKVDSVLKLCKGCPEEKDRIDYKIENNSGINELEKDCYKLLLFLNLERLKCKH